MSDYSTFEADGRIIRTMRVPNYSEQTIGKAVDSWRGAMDVYQTWLDDNFGGRTGDRPYELDEIAFLFEDRDAKWEWVEFAVRDPRIKLFNSADDYVTTEPLSSSYNVEYAFLEIRDAGFRVEAMNIGSGRSPLHETLRERMWTGEIKQPVGVHLSFKCDDEEDFRRVCYELDQMAGVRLAQSCQSDYGAFSYYKVFDLWNNHAGLYLKPRYNKRYEQSAATEEGGESVPEGTGEGAPTIGSNLRRLIKK